MPNDATRHHPEVLQQVLRRELTAAINSASLSALSGRIELSWGHASNGDASLHSPPQPAAPLDSSAHTLRFAISDGVFEWLPADADVDVTFYFDDEDALRRVLAGDDNPIDHFMRGDFRSSGYLLWTFPLLTLFRGNS